MLGWCIVTLASARLKASMQFPPLRGMYQRGGTCKGCDSQHKPWHWRRQYYSGREVCVASTLRSLYMKL